MLKINKIIEHIPLIEMLRIIAVCALVIGLINIIVTAIWPYFISSDLAVSKSIFIQLHMIVSGLIHILFEPAILLALAEVIKLMRENNAKNQ